MTFSIERSAYRKLRRFPQYKHHDSADFPNKIWQLVKLAPNEFAVGLYENVPGQLDESFLLTSEGVHFLSDNASRFVCFLAIESVGFYTNSKSKLLHSPEHRKLIFVLRNGEKVLLPIRGAREAGVDIASFLSFISRVVIEKRTVAAGR